MPKKQPQYSPDKLQKALRNACEKILEARADVLGYIPSDMTVESLMQECMADVY